MKRNIFFSLLIGFTLSMIVSGNNKSQAQTAGTFTFTYSQAAPSASATKNVMAVWIEDNSGTFVKTRLRYWSNSTNDHLPSWVSKSAQNTVDATTGATRTASTVPTAFGAKTITWDGKNASGVLVPDGIYNVFVESSYCNPEPANNQHWIITNFSFTKGTTAVHLTPTGPANFSNISLDWVPSTVGVDEVIENSTNVVFPNPSNGIININYVEASNIKIENILGAVVYEENVSKSGSKTIDLSKHSNGTYFVAIKSAKSNTIQKYKVLLNK